VPGVYRLAYRHPRVQFVRRLVARRSAREDEGSFVIEGVNLLEEALSAGTQLQAVYVDGGWAAAQASHPPPRTGPGDVASQAARPSGERLGTLLDRCYEAGARVFELEPGVLARVAGTVAPQPVIAVVRANKQGLTDIEARRPSLVVMCIDVRDPGNAGTVLRSAWAAGASGVICCGGTVDVHNPKTVRASAGAVLHVPVVYEASALVGLGAVGAWGLRRLGTVAKGGDDYAACDLSGPVALVLGNEAAGLPLDELSGHLDGLVTIPMAPGAGSLNVGMAAAILCFESARQRRRAWPAGSAQNGPSGTD
jgi:TrmH family RNA methyltransferase